MRLLGLDVGERRIGVAASDPGGVLAFPLIILERRVEGRDMEAVARLVAEHGAGGVVVGLPRSLSGATGTQAERVLTFVAALKQKLGVPVHTYDERLSTVVAERRQREVGKPGKKGKGGRGVPKKHLDAEAAAVILQGYLDRQKVGL
ncbi:MAG: Holliday junction resolvase RuvX [Dehalococcoidia bacterium]